MMMRDDDKDATLCYRPRDAAMAPPSNKFGTEMSP